MFRAVPDTRFAPPQRAAPHADGDSLGVTALAILPMARHREGQTGQARQLLKEAGAILTRKLPKVERGEHYGNDWHDWLRAQLLYHEAQALLKAAASDGGG